MKFKVTMVLFVLIFAVVTATIGEANAGSDPAVGNPVGPLAAADGLGPPIIGPGKEYVTFYEAGLNMTTVDSRGDDYFMETGTDGEPVVAVAITPEEHAQAHALGIEHTHPSDQPGKLLKAHRGFTK